jgi:hypothetical protein
MSGTIRAGLVELVPVAAPGTGGDGPLSLLLDAVASGCRTLPALAARTGLTIDVVRAGLDHLVRSGRLEARGLTAGCPAGGCGGCAVARGGGGCGLGC